MVVNPKSPKNKLKEPRNAHKKEQSRLKKAQRIPMTKSKAFKSASNDLSNPTINETCKGGEGGRHRKR